VPDFTIHTAPICRSNQDWSRVVPSETDVSKQYIVSYRERFADTGPAFDYECTCPAYKYGNGKYCKHIHAVKDERCCWNEAMEPKAVPEDGCCPDCGNEIILVQVAV